MSLKYWTENARWYFENRPPREATKMLAGELFAGAIRRVTPHLPHPGTPIVEKDWEVLVVLDACRPEALAEVAGEFDFLPRQVETTLSQASASAEWMATNFPPERRSQTRPVAHVTANPNSDEQLDPDDWLVLDEVWRTHWDEDAQMVPPRPVTDLAVTRWRELDADRMIVHYMQPHAPYPGFLPDGIDDVTEFDRTARRTGEFSWLKEGRVTKSEMWEAYCDTLRLVLEDVGLLLSNLDSENVVITADHAELFGEYGLYAHPIRTWVPKLLRVPWVPVSGTDTGKYDPEVDLEAEESNDTVDDQLRALGYRT